MILTRRRRIIGRREGLKIDCVKVFHFYFMSCHVIVMSCYVMLCSIFPIAIGRRNKNEVYLVCHGATIYGGGGVYILDSIHVKYGIHNILCYYVTVCHVYNIYYILCVLCICHMIMRYTILCVCLLYYILPFPFV